jgi:hypothetical protein
MSHIFASAVHPVDRFPGSWFVPTVLSLRVPPARRCHGDGPTREAAIADLREALAAMGEFGIPDELTVTVEVASCRKCRRYAANLKAGLGGQVRSVGPSTVNRRFACWEVGATLAGQLSVTARQHLIGW